MQQQKEINPAASLVIDFGGSGARSIGLKIKSGLGKPILICLDPEVEPVDKDSIDAYQSGTMGSTEPENRCWIAAGSEYYAIGCLARERFHATPDLNPLKWEDAVRKTLAAVWVLSEKLNLGNRFGIAIGALLPPGEYKNDKERFEKTLLESVSNFLTPSGRFKVKLEFFDCKPEGGGIYLHRRRVLKDLIKQKVVAIVMVGHRNASILIANKGSVGEGITSALGCNQLVEIFTRETSGTSDQPKDRIITALVSAGATVESRPFLKLARSTSNAGKEQDVEQMVKAAHLARSEYFRALTRWIDKILPIDRYEIVFCGGTAHLFRAELSARYIEDEVLWDAEIEIPPTLETPNLVSRLADVYGMYRTFRDRLTSRLGLTISEKSESNAIVEPSKKPMREITKSTTRN